MGFENVTRDIWQWQAREMIAFDRNSFHNFLGEFWLLSNTSNSSVVQLELGLD